MIAYIRDSARPFPLAMRQAALAAFAAFSRQEMTASALTAPGPQHHRQQSQQSGIPGTCFFIQSSLEFFD